MTTFIPKLARIASGTETGSPRTAVDLGSGVEQAVDAATLARLAEKLRQRLAIGPVFSDAALVASLSTIVRQPSHEARWRAAEASTLGQYLAIGNQDLHRTLVRLLAELPKPTL